MPSRRPEWLVLERCSVVKLLLQRGELGFTSQHPHPAAPNHLGLQVQGLWHPLVASVSTATDPIPTATQIHILKNK